MVTGMYTESGSDTGKTLVLSSSTMISLEVNKCSNSPISVCQYSDILEAKGRFLGWWAVMTQAAFSYMCVFFSIILRLAF
jgi:hypothetical protein